MNRNQHASAFNFAFVAFRFIFGNAQSHQRTGDTAERSTNGGTCQGSHDWSGRNQRSDARNGKCADPCQPTEAATDYSPSSGSGRRASGALCLVVDGEFFGAFCI